MKIREIKATDGLPAGGIRVLVKDGIYRLTEGFVFTEEDSGSDEAPITYVSESEFGARIMGSVVLSADDFEPINAEEESRLMDKSAAEHIVKIDLTKYGLSSDDWGEYILSGNHSTGMWYDEFNEAFLSEGIDYTTAEWVDWSNTYSEVPGAHESEVFIGDVALISARWPNKGEWVYTDTDDVLMYNENGWANFMVRNPEGQMYAIDGAGIDRVAQWSSLEDIWIGGYIGCSWAGSTNKIESFDFENKTMKLKYLAFYAKLADGLDRKWYYFNIFDELDVEGEFYLDRENGILYVYKTENFYEDDIKISTLAEDIFSLKNVSNITFKGFDISESRCNGFRGTAENLIIDNCLIKNLRNGAINIIGNKICAQNNEIFNLGSYGIFLEGGDMETLTKSENVVYNNYIHDWARVDTTYKTGIAVRGVGSLVSHNELCNTTHQALNYRGPYHIFEYNEIYNVLMETADCGAIYAYGNLISYGSEIRYNFIHDIGDMGYNPNGVSAHGIYLDGAVSGQKVYGNIIMNTAGNGLHIGSGRDNFIENNVVINSTMAPIHFSNYTRLFTLSNFTSGNTAYFEYANELKSYLNDAWYEAFPEYRTMVLASRDYDGDLDNPYLSTNPANGAVRNNILYILNETTYTRVHPKHGYVMNSTYKRVELYSDKGISDVDKLNDISNNPIIFNDYSDFRNWHNDDFTMNEDALGLELCPDFEPIPFDQIGRVN